MQNLNEHKVQSQSTLTIITTIIIIAIVTVLLTVLRSCKIYWIKRIKMPCRTSTTVIIIMIMRRRIRNMITIMNTIIKIMINMMKMTETNLKKVSKSNEKKMMMMMILTTTIMMMILTNLLPAIITKRKRIAKIKKYLNSIKVEKEVITNRCKANLKPELHLWKALISCTIQIIIKPYVISNDTHNNEKVSS